LEKPRARKWDAARPAGASDTARAADLLAARLPEPLEVFSGLAYDFACFWSPEGRRLFAEIDPHTWERTGRNPVRLLDETPVDLLVRAAGNRELVQRAHALHDLLLSRHARPFRCENGISSDHPVAFLCGEFGVYPSLAIYAGGLGMLAGDLVKEASDRGIPFVGIGLYYRQGYFHQRLNSSGWQREYWVETPPHRVPLALVTDEWGIPVTVTLRMRGEDVVLQIWRAAVGRTSLYLLDADRPENSVIGRWLTARLYDSNPEIRLAQYAVLGIGGIRALRALRIDPAVIHLNEGHAALAAFELAREKVAAGLSPQAAFDDVREQLVFTTHTPVPAGNETYASEALWQVLDGQAESLGLSPGELIDRGRLHPGDASEPLGLTVLALRTSRAANGVSRVHGGVARAMWRTLWPDRVVEEVPIGHITNGVHLPTWMAPPMRDLLDRYLGPDWVERAADPATWDAVEEIPDGEIWSVRNTMRRHCIKYVSERVATDFLGRAQSTALIETWTGGLSPDRLTVGFARRLAAYKRIDLLPLRTDAFRRLLASGVQFLVAGKAHPRDRDAKSRFQRIAAAMGAEEAHKRVAFVEDYDVAVTTRMVAGCDIWLNLPRPPLEASGTSGMKAMLNGGLNVSVLDGWWAEAFDGSNGWGLPADPAVNERARDDRDAARVFDLFAQEVLPLFHDRDATGIPRGWIQRIKHSLRTNGPRYCMARVLDDYARKVYAKR
jgi:starch phosphorylase